MITAYPLQWPAGWPRSKFKQDSRLAKYSFAQARDDCLDELQRLGATDVVMSSNLTLRQDGLPYSGQRQPEDAGIVVYFKLRGEDQCIPCDKWSSIEQNLRAITKTIDALRGIERWGAKEMVNAAFRGFKALPENAIVTPYMKRAWYEVLEVSQTAGPEIIKAAYRQKMLKAHPDHGGSIDDFNEVQDAFKEAGV